MSLGIEEDNKKTDEHILVCLSAAPSNKKIIDTAAKMANALQARFTALYVRTGTKSEDLDKEKLEEMKEELKKNARELAEQRSIRSAGERLKVVYRLSGVNVLQSTHRGLPHRSVWKQEI